MAKRRRRIGDYDEEWIYSVPHERRIANIKSIALAQKADETLWGVPETDLEGKLQEELIRLHAMIERKVEQ